MMSEMDAGIDSAVCRPLAPLDRTARSSEMTIIAKGLSWDSQQTVMDVRKNRELLGFKPRYSVEEGMKITCDWLRWSDLNTPKS